MILTTKCESNPKATVLNGSEKSMHVNIHDFKKASSAKLYSDICTYMAKQREIGVFCLIEKNGKSRSNTRTSSLKQTYFLGILEQLFLGTPGCCARYSFLRNVFVGLHVYNSLHNFSWSIGLTH